MKKKTSQNTEAKKRAKLSSYMATRSDKMRRPVYYSTRSEDRELQPRERQTLISEARLTLRNFTLAGFALRKHLQFMSYYRFSAGTPNDSFNRALEKRVKRWESECDATGRRNFQSLMYLVESARAVDGDVGLLKLSNGRVQLIEGDRIRNSSGNDLTDEWVHGVRVNQFGKILAYDVSKRTPYSGFEHERFISAKNLDLLGYYTRPDEIRGVSLLAPASRLLSQLTDCIDLALSKQRLEQAFGLAATMDTPGPLADMDEETEKAIQERGDSFHRQATDVFGEGVFSYIMSPGEEVRFLESNNPSSNFQAFAEQIIRLTFAAWDIPYSFFDNANNSWSGANAETAHYIDSLEQKQNPTITILDRWLFEWLIPLWVFDEGSLELPEGWTIDDLKGDIGWSGASYPQFVMLDRVKELLVALQAGLLPPSETIGSYGYDIRRNLEDAASVRQYAEQLGLSVNFGQSADATNIGL